jgi:hypothetical protein
MERYGLPPHVFVAFDGPYSVWLDLRRDRYFAIERNQTRAFHDLVSGWSSQSAGASLLPDRPDGRSVMGPLAENQGALASMLKSGLLVDLRERSDAKPALPARATAFSGEIRLPVLAQPPRVRAHHVFNLAVASIIGAATLKFLGLAGVIARMRRRRISVPDESGSGFVKADARRSEPAASDLGGPGLDERSLLELVSVFATLRPFFFALRGRCLLSSVVLSEFLARYRMRSHCVFGVRARPFAAHCWLEIGNRVLNDSVERVRAFTPILRV